MPPAMILFEISLGGMLTLSKTSSFPDGIINTWDSIKNLSQTQIFFKADQTWTKLDQVDLDDPDDLIQLMPDVSTWVYSYQLRAHFEGKCFTDITTDKMECG